MSRSVHTDQPRIRASRRLRTPRAPRRAGDPRASYLVGRRRKQLDLPSIAANGQAARQSRSQIGPRIVARRPGPGHFFPLGLNDLRILLDRMDAPLVYGLRSIELHPSPVHPGADQILLARYLVPGRILMFDLPRPPWLVRGKLCPEHVAAMTTAGASIILLELGARVEWPGHSLRDYVVQHGLLHEVAHHVVQQYTGKRAVRVRRTRDHERWAFAFASAHRHLVDGLREENR